MRKVKIRIKQKGQLLFTEQPDTVRRWEMQA